MTVSCAPFGIRVPTPEVAGVSGPFGFWCRCHTSRPVKAPLRGAATVGAGCAAGSATPHLSRQDALTIHYGKRAAI